MPFSTCEINLRIRCERCDYIGASVRCDATDTDPSYVASLRAQLRAWVLCGLFTAGWRERTHDAAMFCPACAEAVL